MTANTGPYDISLALVLWATQFVMEEYHSCSIPARWKLSWYDATDLTANSGENLSASYSLCQECSNPINPSIQIKFAVRKTSHVSLSMYKSFRTGSPPTNRPNDIRGVFRGYVGSLGRRWQNCCIGVQAVSHEGGRAHRDNRKIVLLK